jgi:hypothetical protein
VKVRLVATSLLLVAALLGGLLLWCQWVEAPYYYYATASSLPDRAGARDPGWKTLPDSAREIHRQYDLDSNESVLAFQFDAALGCGWLDHLEELSPESVPSARIDLPRFRRGWWPAELGGRLEADQLRESSYRFFREPQPHPEPWYWAVDCANGRAYRWNLGF